jgi:hypothetical protein
MSGGGRRLDGVLAAHPADPESGPEEKQHRKNGDDGRKQCRE